MPKKPASLTDWIRNTVPRQPTKCTVCRNVKLAEAIAQFRQARADGRTAISWAQFRREFLLPNGLEVAYDTMQNHLRKCLGER